MHNNSKGDSQVPAEWLANRRTTADSLFNPELWLSTYNKSREDLDSHFLNKNPIRKIARPTSETRRYSSHNNSVMESHDDHSISKRHPPSAKQELPKEDIKCCFSSLFESRRSHSKKKENPTQVKEDSKLQLK